jgi:Protein of unknown function (DUF1573)
MTKRIITAAICIGGIYGVMAAEGAPKAASGIPKIKFDRTAYDFGKTSQVERVSGTFTFRNVGDGVLKLGRPTTSCGCTVAGVKPNVLQPGEKGELDFTLTLPQTKAVLHKQIVVDSNDPASPRTVLSIKADYTPLYDVTPVNFYMTLRQGASTNVVARVTRTDGKAFTVTKIQPTQSWIQAKAEPDPNSTSAKPSVRISATLKPEGSPRYFTEFLQVYVDNSPKPEFLMTISGRLMGDLTLTPESLYWPITDPDRALTTRHVIIRSALPDRLQIKNLSSTVQNLNLEAVPREDGKTLELVAKLATIPDRTTNGIIRFETNVPSQPTVVVPVWINVIKRR